MNGALARMRRVKKGKNPGERGRNPGERAGTQEATTPAIFQTKILSWASWASWVPELSPFLSLLLSSAEFLLLSPFLSLLLSSAEFLLLSSAEFL